MNIVFKLKVNESLSENECEKILALLQSELAGKIDLNINEYTEGGAEKPQSVCSLTKELLINNLTAMQNDALELEEQITHLKEQNNYLEEKVNWLRGKVSESNFIPSKAKPESRFPLDNSRLQSALVGVINAMESTALEKARLPFFKSKRARKDKALLAQSEYFDKEYVANQLKQLGLKVKNPLEFFVSYGAALELSPSEKFDTKSYLAMNPDVKDSGINPLLHYIKHGKAEGRVLI